MDRDGYKKTNGCNIALGVYVLSDQFSKSTLVSALIMSAALGFAINIRSYCCGPVDVFVCATVIGFMKNLLKHV